MMMISVIIDNFSFTALYITRWPVTASPVIGCLFCLRFMYNFLFKFYRLTWLASKYKKMFMETNWNVSSGINDKYIFIKNRILLCLHDFM